MNILFTIILAVVGSSGVASVVVACLQRHWSKKDKEDGRIDALVAAQKVLMIDRVNYLGREYIKQGYIELSDKKNLRAMHEAYKELGGNGDLNTVMDEVNRLEVRG